MICYFYCLLLKKRIEEGALWERCHAVVNVLMCECVNA